MSPVQDWQALTRLRHRSVGMCNGGWAYDAYPELETLDAGRATTIADIDGPAVITNLHIIQHLPADPKLEPVQLSALAARGLVLEVYFDGAALPSICAPLADFFGDGCSGRAGEFTSMFIEKAPKSYNCFIPMPFASHARVVLRNDTVYDLMSYSFVEFERLDQWLTDTGYLHATWRRFAFQLDSDSNELVLHLEGHGHLIGQSWSMVTDDPFFKYLHFLMEGNVEYHVDDEGRPRLEYLGTEDAFGFSWGLQNQFAGLRNGITFVQPEMPMMASAYRFRAESPLGYERSLDVRVNWCSEFRSERFLRDVKPRYPNVQFSPPPRSQGRGWVDYATTFYWYQRSVGHSHEPLPSVADRVADVLRPNP